jgi:hypothetical protein
MSLHRNPHSARIGMWLTIAAMVLATIAAVQLVAGSSPLVWLLAGCVAVWALLAQASHAQDAPIRVRSSRYGARSAYR